MKKIDSRWITQTAVMLALLITLQWTTSYIPKPFQQYVTGSLVNAVLAVSALMLRYSGGLTVALLSPVFAFILGIAPNILTVPIIMLGNAIYVSILHPASGKTALCSGILWISASAAKFLSLYLPVKFILCGIASEILLAHGLLNETMLNVLPATFSWPQLITALIGGGIALTIVSVLKKHFVKE